jgi:hypothetical protein
MLQQPFVVDIEAQGAGGGIQIGSVDEKGDTFLREEMHENSNTSSK